MAYLSGSGLTPMLKAILMSKLAAVSGKISFRKPEMTLRMGDTCTACSTSFFLEIIQQARQTQQTHRTHKSIHVRMLKTWLFSVMSLMNGFCHGHVLVLHNG